MDMKSNSLILAMCAAAMTAPPAVAALPGRPASLTRVISLNGDWKFKGLDRQETPFGTTTDAEKALLSAATDDRDWDVIRVPLNWWRHPRTHIDRVRHATEIYFRGYYRRTVEVADPKDGRRRLLRFQGVGRDAEVYVNGRKAAFHQGEFTPFEVDVTPLLKPGANLVALRVLADFGPKKGEAWRHGYGATWGVWIYKGGLWLDVELVETPPIRFAELQLDPAPTLDAVTAHWTLETPEAVGSAELVAVLREAGSGKTVVRGEPVRVTLGRGRSSGELTLAAPGVRPWHPDSPSLYYLTLELRRDGQMVSDVTERFGFRHMEIRGNRFYLNGRPIYLYGDSAHSGQWGGNGVDDRPRLEKLLRHHKANGVNVLRTAHMPAAPIVCEAADEVGMMIYDEWCLCFAPKIDEPEFERQNLTGLAEFIRRDYNYPSVVMWSLGNEIHHRFDPALPRQLDKQYDLLKRLDRQNRPASSFSGNAVVAAYGRTPLKTDFFDFHNYVGIDNEDWTSWFPIMDDKFLPPLREVYGAGCETNRPVVVFECVGAGWGIRKLPDLPRGDAAAFVKFLSGPSVAYGDDTDVSFSTSTGLYPLTDPRTGGPHYIQAYLGRRTLELCLQDPRITGFAPWFADPNVPGWPRWTQRVYPLLRCGKAGDRAFMPRQWTSPSRRTLECAVLNKRAERVRNVRVSFSFAAPGREPAPLGSAKVGEVAPFGETAVRCTLELPDGLPPAGEIKLDLTADGGVTAWNGYDVTVHPKAVHDRDAAIARRPADEKAPLPKTKTLVLGAGDWQGRDAELRTFVRKGGVLLVDEPAVGCVPGFPELLVVPIANHLTEIVVTNHPAFAGLCPADFDLWTENAFGNVFTKAVRPMGDGLVAGTRLGATLCEYAYGRGRVIVSTLDAANIRADNPSAARYRANLIRYAHGGALRTKDVPRLADLPDRMPKGGLSEKAWTVPGLPAEIDFAAAEKGASPCRIFSFMPQASEIARDGYTHLELTYRATGRGLMDITLPRRDHGSRYTFTLPVAATDRPQTVLLEIAKDFRFADPSRPFTMADYRGEVLVYNGYEKDRGYPRPPFEIEILSIRFRKAAGACACVVPRKPSDSMNNSKKQKE